VNRQRRAKHLRLASAAADCAPTNSADSISPVEARGFSPAGGAGRKRGFSPRAGPKSAALSLLPCSPASVARSESATENLQGFLPYGLVQ